MNVVELKACITSNNIPNLLVFTGEERVVLQVYIDQIIKKTASLFNCKKCDTVAQIFQYNIGSLFSTKANLFIVEDDEVFFKTSEAWDNIKKVCEKNKIILCYHTYDARQGFWKKFKKETVVFEKLEANILAKHLQQDYKLPFETCVVVAKGCDCDFSRSLLELDKLKCLSHHLGEELSQSFFNKYKDVLCLDNYKTIFDWVQSVLQKNWTESFKLYRDLKEKQEPVVKLLSILSAMV